MGADSDGIGIGLVCWGWLGVAITMIEWGNGNFQGYLSMAGPGKKPVQVFRT
jgi:hypothetical protein